MSTNLPDPKKAVARIRGAFVARQSDISTKDAYDLLAQVWGYKDWATASAMLKDAPTEKPLPVGPTRLSPGDVKHWHVWVFCNKGQGEDTPLYVYPYGTELRKLYASPRHWTLIDDSKTFAMEMPADLMGPENAQQIAGEQIACAYPDGLKYGIPTAASEAGAPEFLREELGFSYVGTNEGTPLVEVTSRDREDDGMTEWWMQVCVHPTLHAKLLAVLTAERFKFEELRHTLPCAAMLLPSPEVNLSRARTVLSNRMGRWFSSYGEETVAALSDRLCNWHERAPAVEALPPGFALQDMKAGASVGELYLAVSCAVQTARTVLEPS